MSYSCWFTTDEQAQVKLKMWKHKLPPWLTECDFEKKPTWTFIFPPVFICSQLQFNKLPQTQAPSQYLLFHISVDEEFRAREIAGERNPWGWLAWPLGGDGHLELHNGKEASTAKRVGGWEPAKAVTAPSTHQGNEETKWNLLGQSLTQGSWNIERRAWRSGWWCMS